MAQPHMLGSLCFDGERRTKVLSRRKSSAEATGTEEADVHGREHMISTHAKRVMTIGKQGERASSIKVLSRAHSSASRKVREILKVERKCQKHPRS